jgi:hypothetical protein
MLRPEQLSVTACASHESPISILDVDFTGHLSTLTLGLTGQPQPVTLKTVSQPDGTRARRFALILLAPRVYSTILNIR